MKRDCDSRWGGLGATRGTWWWGGCGPSCRYRDVANRNARHQNRFGSAENLLEKVIRTPHALGPTPEAGVHSRDIKANDRIGKKRKDTNLSIVDIAILVKLVVHTQNGQVQPIRGSNSLTCITGFDNVSGQAVLADKTKADGPAHLEITATLVS